MLAPSSGGGPAPPRRRQVLAERIQPCEEAYWRFVVVDHVGLDIFRRDDELAAVPALRRAELDELRAQPLVVKSRILGDGVAVRALLVGRDVAALAPPEPDESVWKSNFRRLTPSTRR